MRSNLTDTLSCGASAIALALSASAAAQVDEIVVTAQKRQSTLLETPVAVSVIGEEALQQGVALDIRDLQILTPSLTVDQQSGAGVVTYAIRGIGTSSDNFALEPSVSVYIDGVYRARQAGAVNDFIDIDRVEVLRGPQGTLYGRNSTAGVISYVTKAPEFEYGGELSASYGNYDQKILRGTVTGPLLGDAAAIRVSGAFRKRDGFYENEFDGSDPNDIDRWAVRSSILYQPSDATEVTLAGEYGTLDENCCAAPYLDNFGANPILIEALGGTIPTIDPDVDAFDRVVNFDGNLLTTIYTKMLSAKVDHDFGWSNLTVVGAWNDFSEERDLDSDFNDTRAGGRRFIANGIKDYQLEARFSGSQDRFDWLLGATFYEQALTTRDETPYGEQLREFAGLNIGIAQGLLAPNPATDALSTTPAGQALFGVPVGAPLDPAIVEALANGIIGGLEGQIGVPTGSFFAGGGQSGVIFADYAQDTTSFAAFAQVDFDVTDRLTLTVGGRIAHEEQDYEADVDVRDAFAAINFIDVGVVDTFLNGSLAPLGVDPRDPAQLQGFLSIPAGNAFLPGGVSGAQLFQQVYEGAADPNLNPLLGLTGLQFFPPATGEAIDGATRDQTYEAFNVIASYDVSDTLSAYASFSTGYKPQGANLTPTAEGPALSQFYAPYAAVGGTAIPAPQDITPFFDEESVEAIEVGFKGRFLENRLTTNFALFDVTNEDFQAVAFDGNGFTLRNAGDLKVQGMEIEGILAPADALTFTYGWTHLFTNEYEEYLQGPCPDTVPATPFNEPLNTDVPASCFNEQVQDLSGVGRVGANDTVSLTGTWEPTIGRFPTFLRGEYYYRSEARLADDQDDRKVQDGFSLVNLSAGISDPSERYQLQVWARNVFEEDFLVGTFSSVGQPGSLNTYLNDPRTYGVTLRANW